jgi:hypothetical protein
MMRRHELDPISLTFGFAFTGLGLLFLLGQADEALRLRWVWPLLLLALGAGILLDLARSSRRADRAPDTDPDLETAGVPAPKADVDPHAEAEPDPQSKADLDPDRKG